ncbi:hypothetical protein H8J86_08145 [Clostridium perfringens]|uniref:hypothetical protein n=1 Tax=Clostridium perfringens TaxID=1502 RepID=UPI0013E371AE|nr:hypothetical protein [Clostridium perfringens]MBI6005923.1 hypothetical protein [Clostridium perfringens]MDK0621512.1 hypothetical protein [Clostridium perfringens]NGS95731.1 hypothetical protein [Clostridium perfringens]
MNIERRYGYISKEKIKKKNFIKRFVCKHNWVDDLLSEGFYALNGRRHIVYCKNCGKVKGYYWEEY